MTQCSLVSMRCSDATGRALKNPPSSTGRPSVRDLRRQRVTHRRGGRLVRIWLFVGVALTVSACGDSTGPGADSSIDVLVSVTQVLGPNFSTDADSAPK